MPGQPLLALTKAVLDGDEVEAESQTRRVLTEGMNALQVIDQGLLPGIRRAGELWQEGEYFLPELVSSAQAMKRAMDVVKPLLTQTAAGTSRGRLVIGTVQGDIHDIGKTLVASLAAAHGFAVTDLGVDVPASRFVECAREVEADLVCCSALLTTTMARQRDVVVAVRGAGLRARVMVGGAPVSQSWADEVGADGYADSAVSAVDVARRLVGSR